MGKSTMMPSPSDIAYVDEGVFAYIMDILREVRVDYKSQPCDFIKNEVLKEARARICASIQPK